jgi:hypothetical protein
MRDGLRGAAGSNEQDGRVVVKIRVARLEADGLEDPVQFREATTPRL